MLKPTNRIKKAVEKMYGVTVASVKNNQVSGKSKNQYTSAKVISGRTPTYKKAIVSVGEGK
jgi:large subunit ribosomal protein L23